MGKFVKLCTER